MSFKIIQGGSTYDFEYYPSEMTNFKKDKDCAFVRTYSGVDHFTWGLTRQGKVIEMLWYAMPISMYNSLTSLYESQTTMDLSNTADWSSSLYNVEFTGLEGDYLFNISNTATAVYRANVKAKFLILSTV